MTSISLELKAPKTEVLITAPDASKSKVASSSGFLSCNVCPKLLNLKVIFEMKCC